MAISFLRITADIAVFFYLFVLKSVSAFDVSYIRFFVLLAKDFLLLLSNEFRPGFRIANASDIFIVKVPTDESLSYSFSNTSRNFK